eukprot:PhF_6_TR31365/c0_g1_i2/m.45911
MSSRFRAMVPFRFLMLSFILFHIWAIENKLWGLSWPFLPQAEQTTGYDKSRKCFLTVPIEERGVVCPNQKYMGFTNIVLNIVQCIHLARDVCHHGRAYIPLRIQHASIDDLFARSAWKTIQKKYNVSIHFYCDDGIIAKQQGLLSEKVFLRRAGRRTSWKNISRYLIYQFNRTIFVQDAMTTRFGSETTVNDMILILTKHLNPTVASYVEAINTGLRKYNRETRPKHLRSSTVYTVIHLRFESDTWTLLTFKETAFNFPFMLEQQIDRKIMVNDSTTNVVLYGTGSPLKYFGKNKKVHYKRDYMDESKVIQPYITEYWNALNIPTLPPAPNRTSSPPKNFTPKTMRYKVKDKNGTRWIVYNTTEAPPTPAPTPAPIVMVNVTNSTGALIDFVMALYADQSVLAKFSSFGNQLASLRCQFRLGETWTYRTNYKMRKAC